MSMSSNSVVGIVLVMVLAALIGSIFIGDVLGQVEDEGSNQVVISSPEEMMKLVLYDSMIAYNCGGGGMRDVDNDLYWGSWEDMKGIWENPGIGQIEFDDLNNSMPTVFEGLPCYGSETTLPTTGGTAANLPNSPIKKQFKDDQEGKYSKIEFKTNDSIELPSCFVHWTKDDFPTGPGDMYEAVGNNQVTNSWFLVTDENQLSAFHRGGAGIGSGRINMHTSCEHIADGGDDSEGYGPIMTLTVIDDHTSGLNELATVTPSAIIGDESPGGHFDPNPDPELKRFEFPEGTTGFVQSNIGCQAGSAPYSIGNLPGKGDTELESKSKVCQNSIHPSIVITNVG